VTPPAAHLNILKEAAHRGVDVICQKPLGGDLETAREMVRIAQDAGITFVAHENFRFQPWYREARRLLDAGALGEVYNLSFRCGQVTARGRAPIWTASRTFSRCRVS
jgi:predicted dehydrogenase